MIIANLIYILYDGTAHMRWFKFAHTHTAAHILFIIKYDFDLSATTTAQCIRYTCIHMRIAHAQWLDIDSLQSHRNAWQCRVCASVKFYSISLSPSNAIRLKIKYIHAVNIVVYCDTIFHWTIIITTAHKYIGHRRTALIIPNSSTTSIPKRSSAHKITSAFICTERTSNRAMWRNSKWT